ncbi:M14 family metallopeptidase [Oleiharenicola lentus]|uniref:M14 family metallopeptidase n=1 Tax=Oleiharenicola lentus TaxID=2508720 RepID=UPI003F67D044
MRSIPSLLKPLGLTLLMAGTCAGLHAAPAPKITPAKDIIGFSIGDDYHMASYTQISQLLKKWDEESDRVKVVSIGTTEEGRPQYMAIITSPKNHEKLEYYRDISVKLSRAEMDEATAKKLSKEGKAVVWVDGGLHATETVNGQTLAEMVYQMASLTDDETMRFLDDVILLMPVPNPDGVELVANWYMRESDVTKRTYATLPRLYHKYIGHDNNRDSMMNNMKETTNQNRVLFIEWMPQIMHNVHQTGPAGAVIFIPPFRDPFNYNFDAMIPIGIEQVGAHMHERLVSKGWGGSAMRSAAPYSTWWNGGMRTATYFHNQIGILTEIIGTPTPMTIPLLPQMQLPTGDLPLPIKPRVFKYREAIDYMIEVERAAVDYASRNRERVLFNIYGMGKRSIERGSKDFWTITPKRVNALKDAADKAPEPEMDEQTRMMVSLGFARKPVAMELYDKVLNDPAMRDPRGYVISPAANDDFPTAVKFINVLQKQGVDVYKATSEVTISGKKYPAGSFIISAAQAFRPIVRDFLESQDHPMDFDYPGGPPKRPYDITGWTIAEQMGVEYDRFFEKFDIPAGATKLPYLPLEKAMSVSISGPANPVGYLLSHRVNDSFIVMNRLLKAGAEVYWLEAEQTVNGHGLGTGTMYVPASAKALPILEAGAKDLGVQVFGVATKPTGAATKLKPVRIGLVDIYGGSMPSGWIRWMFEQFEFPFEVVFPQVLDAGNLKDSFDVIVFPSDTFRAGARGGRGGRERAGPDPETIPEEFRSMLGSTSVTKTIPPLKTFVEQGGSIVALGSSATIGEAMGLPIKDHLTETDKDGKEKSLPSNKFYIPGSLLNAKFNNKNPIAYGMPEKGYVFFDSSPVFERTTDTKVTANKIAWFEGKEPLHSGWAVGQEYLDGGELASEATIGKGKVVIIGFEATFRSTPHANFKLFFNSLYYGSGEATKL